MALIDQKQQDQRQQKDKPVYFVLKKRTTHHGWMPISYFDEEGHFRGIAVFTSLFEAEKYAKKYEDKMMNHYLAANKGEGKNPGSKHHYMMSKDTKVKIFVEKNYPSMYGK